MITSLSAAGFWGGWSDAQSEGEFRDINTDLPLAIDAFQPWYFGEPNGNTIENCQTVWPYRDAWNDLSCSDPAPFFCEFEVAPYFQMRGTYVLTVATQKNKCIILGNGIHANLVMWSGCQLIIHCIRRTLLRLPVRLKVQLDGRHDERTIQL